jgi:hypothetical protein
MIPRPHRDHTSTAFSDLDSRDERVVEPDPHGCDAPSFPGREAPLSCYAGSGHYPGSETEADCQESVWWLSEKRIDGELEIAREVRRYPILHGRDQLEDQSKLVLRLFVGARWKPSPLWR